MRMGELQQMRPKRGTLGQSARAKTSAAKPEPAKWVAADWGAIQREVNKIRRRVIPMLGILVLLVAGCTTPPSGKTFSVSCYSGGQRIWQASDVTSYIAGTSGYVYTSAAQGRVAVPLGADCIISEADE